MKALLLTDIPPTKDFTAGLVLDQLCHFMPPDSLCCFAVVNPELNLQMSRDLSAIPIVFRPKPNENWVWLGTGRLAAVAVWLCEQWTKRFPVKSLLREAIEFGRKERVDRIWAVLQGQTIIRLTGLLAEHLQVPLYTQVWDPFSWWACANNLDFRTTREVSATFEAVVRRSAASATASPIMAELFRRRYGVKAVALMSSHPRSVARLPSPSIGSDHALSIGMAGQFYAANEWGSLIHALNCAGWQIAGRKVRITVVGPQAPPTPAPPHVEYLGWKTQAEAIEILSHCDILYCPYPFDFQRKEVAELSFPSKLALYFATGRPTVFHGPDYSSPHHYLRQTGAALCCNRIEASAIYNELERLVTDRKLYEAIARSAHDAFLSDFNLEKMARTFADFIELPVAEEIELHNHASPAGAQFAVRLAPSSKKTPKPWLRAFIYGVLHPLRQFRTSVRSRLSSGEVGSERRRETGFRLVLRCRRAIGLLLRHSPYFRNLYAEIDTLHDQLQTNQRANERLAVQLTETTTYARDLETQIVASVQKMHDAEARATESEHKFHDAEARAYEFKGKFQAAQASIDELRGALIGAEDRAKEHAFKTAARTRAMELELQELRYYLGEQNRPAAALWPRPPIAETLTIPAIGERRNFSTPEELNNAAREAILETDIVLDIGCGIRPMTFFRPRVHVCIEPHQEYVQILSQMSAHQPQLVILHTKASDIVRALADQSVDSIFLIDVIEHLNKQEGLEILNQCRRIARRQIAVFTPFGFVPQDFDDAEADAWGLSGIDLQRHRSGWTPDDFGEGWSFLCCAAYHTADPKGRKRDKPAGAFWALHTKVPDKARLSQHAVLIARRLPPAAARNASWQELWRTLAEFGSDSITCITSPEFSEFSAHIQPRTTRLTVPYHYLSFAAVPTIANDMSWKLVSDSLPTTLLDQILAITRKSDAHIVVLFVEELADAAVGALISRIAGLPVLLIDDGTTDFQKAGWFDEACVDTTLIIRTLEDVLFTGRQGFQTIIEEIAERSNPS
ncbi:MAG TPA: methyltransferase domain-containing protein [Xanthobacteraceae bacterium]|nr:methyltransferase domain-containing protein [Xanthobacteraceae bacterium]